MNSEYVYKTVAKNNNLSETTVKRIYSSLWEFIKREANNANEGEYEDLKVTFRLNGLGWFYIPKKRLKWRKKRIK